jgi:hypothetical protein
LYIQLIFRESGLGISIKFMADGACWSRQAGAPGDKSIDVFCRAGASSLYIHVHNTRRYPDKNICRGAFCAASRATGLKQ